MLKVKLFQEIEVPIGTMQPYNSINVPDNYMKCDGTIISRNEYPELFEIIGTAWGHGDGSTTFHLPDLRGLFARGADDDSGNDLGLEDRTPSNIGGNVDGVGSYQDDSYLSHNHGTGQGNHTHSYRAWDFVDYQAGSFYPATPLPNRGSVVFNNNDGMQIDYDLRKYPYYSGYSVTQSSTLGSESRSKNVSVRYIIRVK